LHQVVFLEHLFPLLLPADFSLLVNQNNNFGPISQEINIAVKTTGKFAKSNQYNKLLFLHAKYKS
jgi:hypothetical protein